MEVIYKYSVIFTCIDNMTQTRSTLTSGYDDAAEATYAYMEQCGKYMSDGCRHTYHEEDNTGMVHDTYEDKLFTYDIVLNIE